MLIEGKPPVRHRKRQSGLEQGCNTRYTILVIKSIYKHKGWNAAEAQYLFNRLIVKPRVDPSKGFLCHQCGRRGHIHSVRMVNIMDLSCLGNEVKIRLETPQIRCSKCGRFHTLRPDFVHPTMGFTWRFMHFVSSLQIYVPARKPAAMSGISHSTVLRIDREVLKRSLPPPNLDGLEGILVDGKYLGPSHGFVTLVVNARTGEPLHMAKGKDGDALESFFKRLTQKQKSSIRFLGIDRANACRAAAVKHLPHVEVCYDAFHLVSNMNEVVDKVRRAEFAHPTESERCRVAGKKYHLPKAGERLDEDDARELEKLLALNRKLNTTYLLKEQFRFVFTQTSDTDAVWQLARWIGMAVKSGVSQVERFARGIADKFNEVINGIRYGINSGRIESANAGIKRIQSKCCGLFDTDYLFMKMHQMYLSRLSPFYQRI